MNFIYLKKSECEIIELLLLAESDQKLFAELGVEEELLLLELEPLLPGVGGHGVAEGGDVVTDVVYARLLQGHRIIQQGVGQVVHCDDHLELLFLDSGQIICSGKVLSNNLSFAILPEQNVSQ